MSPRGMAALRVAATLAHALPGLRVRLRHQEETLLEVAHRADAHGPAIGACAFRRAVACAHEQSKRGIKLAFMGLPAGVELAIDIGVSSGDAALPGGIYSVAVGDERISGFVTTLPQRRCRELLWHYDSDRDRVRLHHDAATEVTFVHTVDPNGTPTDLAELERLVGTLLPDEVLHELAVATR